MAMKDKVRIDESGEVLNTLTEDGREIPDPRPMAPPIGFKRSLPLHDRIRAMVQAEHARVAAEKHVETLKEAEDFMMYDDEDGSDPREGRFAMLPGFEWEENYEPPADFAEMRERLVRAGWTPPPEKGQEASAEKPAKRDVSEKPLDASEAPKMPESPPAGSGKRS